MAKTPGDRGPEIIMEFRIAHLWDSTKQETVLKNGEIEENRLQLPTFYQLRRIKAPILCFPVVESTWRFAVSEMLACLFSVYPVKV